MFTGLPARATALDEIGLAAQERRRLQHVDDRGDRGDLVLGVHVGEHRHADVLASRRRGSRSPPPCPGRETTCRELRFALSYDDLKMNGMPSAAQISFSSPATSICSCARLDDARARQ